MNRIKNIVVGTDFSKYSQNALAQAIRIANWNAAKLQVVHVIEPTLATSLADAYGVSGVGTWRGFRELAQERTVRMISRAQKLSAPTGQTEPLDIAIDVEILFGNPFVHLLRQVRDVSADLLVLGSNGSSDPAQGPGVMATKCLHKAPIKVMLVSERSIEPFKRIVACVGFSDTCHQVLKQAIQAARQYKSSLHVLHVYRSPQGTVDDGASIPEGSPDSQQPLKNILDQRVREFLPPFGSEMNGLKVEIHCAATGDEKTGIIEFVRSSAADLVVLATSGRTQLKGVPKATTAERIIRETSCAVLSIKPADFNYDVGGATRKR